MRGMSLASRKSAAGTSTLVRRVVVCSFATQVAAVLFRRITLRRNRKNDLAHGQNPKKLPTVLQSTRDVVLDTARVFCAVVLMIGCNRGLARWARRFGNRAELATQFLFGAVTSVAFHTLDTQKLRQSLLSSFCMNASLNAGFAAVFDKRKGLGKIASKVLMAVVGAQLAHAFILTPYSMSKSDLRFFRLASGHTQGTHRRVVRVAGGTMEYKGGTSRDSAPTHSRSTDEPTPLDMQSKITDTFCTLVHPNERGCYAAFPSSVSRAFKKAVLLYTPFLGVQIFRAAVAGKLSRSRIRSAMLAYARMVAFLTTFSGTVQWLPCFFCKLIPNCNHKSRWLYAISGFVSAGLSSLCDSSPKLRSVALVLFPRAIQSTILEPERQQLWMQCLIACAVGSLFALHAANKAPNNGAIAYLVRGVQGV